MQSTASENPSFFKGGDVGELSLRNLMGVLLFFLDLCAAIFRHCAVCRTNGLPRGCVFLGDDGIPTWQGPAHARHRGGDVGGAAGGLAPPGPGGGRGGRGRDPRRPPNSSHALNFGSLHNNTPGLLFDSQRDLVP